MKEIKEKQHLIFDNSDMGEIEVLRSKDKGNVVIALIKESTHSTVF